jgi:cytochrome c oxidase subunit 2
VPEGRHTRLRITSNDVIHSFWVPELSQKQDAVPGQFNTLVITPTRTGTWPVICTELCGLGHAVMRSHIDVLASGKFDAWLKGGGAPAAGPAGLAIFQDKGCGGCHTLKSAGANGKVGPDLDNLKQEAAKANRGSLEAFTRESILKPGAYIAPGYPDAMPPALGASIPPKQLDQLVQYLTGGSQ